MSDEMIIQDREELIYLLCEAAEFEHTVMCSYLYAQWTLKRGLDEGVTPTELAAIERWRRSLAQVALEEMLHLSLVNNLLVAIGAAPHLWRPAFPVRPGHFPADVLMSLTPFGEAALDHFMYIERPEGLDLADGAGFGHALHYRRIARPDMLAPSPQDYPSQGHLYHGILQGLVRLCEQMGEERVFVGHEQAQVSVEEFGLPGLFKISDLASAHRAVEEIVLQGEGAPAHRDDSHFARFKLIRSELGELRAAWPGFEPARPVVSNPMLGDSGITRDRVRVVEPLAGQVLDLGNSIYMLMIRTLSQVFAPAPLPRDLRVALATSSNVLMSAMGRVAEIATRLPIDATRAGSTAAPNFELPGSAGALVQTCAARLLGERASELGSAARRMSHVVPLTDVANDLELLAQRFEELHLRFEPHLGAAVDRVAQLSVPPHRSSSPCRRQSCHTLSRPMHRMSPVPTRSHFVSTVADAYTRATACWKHPMSFLPTLRVHGSIRRRRRWNTASASRTVVHRARSPMNAMTVDRRNRRPMSTSCACARTVRMPCTRTSSRRPGSSA